MLRAFFSREQTRWYVASQLTFVVFTFIYAELIGRMFVADIRLLGKRLFCFMSGLGLCQKS